MTAEHLAFLLVLISAATHALWNLLLKCAHDKLITAWMLWIVGAVFLVPFAIWGALTEPIRPQVIWCILGTGLAYVGYSLGLARSYSRGDISLVYPISRGVAPLGAAGLAWIWMGEGLTGWGIVGILLIVGAVIAASWSPETLPHQRDRLRGGILAALGVGLMTAIYSVIDKQGVQLASPLFYLLGTHLAAAVMMVPVLLHRRGWEALHREVGAGRWNAWIPAGALVSGGYLLVLFAMRLAPVGYLVAVRSISVVFAVLLGARVLSEPHAWRRALLAAVVFAGLALIAVAG